MTGAMNDSLLTAQVERLLKSVLQQQQPSDAEAGTPLDETLYEGQVAEELARQRARRNASRILAAEERSARSIPKPVSLTSLLADPDEPVEYLIDGLWPLGGRVVLSAPMKSGKTTFVGNLARALVDGSNFLGRFRVAPVRRVVLIDDEMSRGQIRRWLGAQGIKNSDAVSVFPLRGCVSSFDITEPECRAEWAGLLRDLDAEVLIIDCLRPILDALGLSEDKDAGKFLAALDELCRDAGIKNYAVVVHTGHEGERARGDSRIRDWPDAEWSIKRDTSDNHAPRFFSAFGRDVDIPEGRLDFDPLTRGLTLIAGVTRADVGSIAATRIVLEYARRYPKATTNDLKAVLSGASGAKGSKVRFCVSQGLLEVEKGPNRSMLHSITPAGEEWLREHAVTAKPFGGPVVPSDPP